MTSKNNFSEKSVNPDPFIQFREWYRDHLNAGIAIPETMTLATASEEGRVSARTVLLKEFKDSGFVFFTNYNSRKGLQLKQNRKAALLFYWAESGRQVRVEGIVEKVSQADSESYFSMRPRESQVSAWASEQSSVIPNRDHLDELYNYYDAVYSEKPVEKPPHWGGFLLIPVWFEFWQDREFRLHDRLTYTKDKGTWVIERLAP
jgi:pyridoxamine 5'-phosphate oxidase